MRYAQLWQRIVAELDRAEQDNRVKDWRQRIVSLNQLPAVQDRERGKLWTDDEVFRALVLAVLSSCIDWEKIEVAMQDLPNVYHNFQLEVFAQLTDHDIKTRIVPALKGLGLGLPQLEKDQLNLLDSAKRLFTKRTEHGSLDAYIRELSKAVGGEPIKLAARFSDPKTDKLPGLGLPLAAEFLKNIGFNVAKADRHVRRAVGSFGLMTFTSWEDASGRNAPKPKNGEMMEAMKILEALAAVAEQPCCFVDNAIWLLCCKSGCHLTNDQLRKLANGV